MKILPLGAAESIDEPLGEAESINEPLGEAEFIDEALAPPASLPPDSQ